MHYCGLSARERADTKGEAKGYGNSSSKEDSFSSFLLVVLLRNL